MKLNYQVKLLLCSLTVFIIAIIQMFNKKFDDPLYFYKNVSETADKPATEYVLGNIKKSIDNDRYKQMLLVLLMQHYSVKNNIDAQNIIYRENISEFFQLINSSVIYYKSLDSNFKWDFSYPYCLKYYYSKNDGLSR